MAGGRGFGFGDRRDDERKGLSLGLPRGVRGSSRRGLGSESRAFAGTVGVAASGGLRVPKGGPPLGIFWGEGTDLNFFLGRI